MDTEAWARRIEEALPLLERSRECLVDSDEYENAKTTAATGRLLLLRDNEGDAEAGAELRAQAREVFERLGAGRDLFPGPHVSVR